MNDAELIALFIQTNDPDVFGELYNRYSARVFRYAFSLIHSRKKAEDVTQITFMKVWKGLHKFDVGRPYIPWLYRVARNALIDFERSEGVLRGALREKDDSSFASELPTSEATPEEVLEASELCQAVRECVDELPPPQREAVYLFYFEGIPQTEIANITDVSVNTVASRLYHSRVKLGKCIEDRKGGR